MTTKIIKLCTNFVQRLWGQEDINSPTTIFDNCGLIPDGSTVKIPSKTWSSANAFFETFKPPLMTDYEIKIVDDPDALICFNTSVALVASSLLISLAILL